MRLTDTSKIFIGWGIVITTSLLGFSLLQQKVQNDRKTAMNVRKRMRREKLRREREESESAAEGDKPLT